MNSLGDRIGHFRNIQSLCILVWILNIDSSEKRHIMLNAWHLKMQVCPNEESFIECNLKSYEQRSFVLGEVVILVLECLKKHITVRYIKSYSKKCLSAEMK